MESNKNRRWMVTVGIKLPSNSQQPMQTVRGTLGTYIVWSTAVLCTVYPSCCHSDEEIEELAAPLTGTGRSSSTPIKVCTYVRMCVGIKASGS